MEELLTPETFEFFAKYLLAGFVFLSARSWLVSGERPNINETLVEAVILSLVNQMVSLLTMGWLSSELVSRYATEALFWQVVAQPMFLGLGIGGLSKFSWFPEGLRRLFMPGLRPVTGTLAQAYGRAGSGVFVIVTYEDNTVVYGYFGRNSLAETDRENGGIFLERLYEVGPDGTWTESQPSRSAWIRLKDVRFIEFVETEDRS